jgi:hypothetical protein
MPVVKASELGLLRLRRRRSCGVSGAACVPAWVGCSEGTPTGLPQRGHIDRRAAISSRARKCLPQLHTNLMDMIHLSSAPQISDFGLMIDDRKVVLNHQSSIRNHQSEDHGARSVRRKVMT